MDDFVIYATALKLGYVALGAFGAVYFSAWLDRRAGASFCQILGIIKNDAMASAVYYGLRFVGICLLLGKLVS